MRMKTKVHHRLHEKILELKRLWPQATVYNNFQGGFIMIVMGEFRQGEGKGYDETQIDEAIEHAKRLKQFKSNIKKEVTDVLPIIKAVVEFNCKLDLGYRKNHQLKQKTKRHINKLLELPAVERNHLLNAICEQFGLKAIQQTTLNL